MHSSANREACVNWYSFYGQCLHKIKYVSRLCKTWKYLSDYGIEVLWQNVMKKCRNELCGFHLWDYTKSVTNLEVYDAPITTISCVKRISSLAGRFLKKFIFYEDFTRKQNHCESIHDKLGLAQQQLTSSFLELVCLCAKMTGNRSLKYDPCAGRGRQDVIP